jgi:hypothetical protein
MPPHWQINSLHISPIHRIIPRKALFARPIYIVDDKYCHPQVPQSCNFPFLTGVGRVNKKERSARKSFCFLHLDPQAGFLAQRLYLFS